MKVALITGVSGGLGKSVAKKFIDEGYFVVGSFNSGEKRISEFISELEKENKQDYFFPIKADFNSAESVTALYNIATKSFKHFDVLVNCAGVDLYKTFTDTTEKEWDNVFNVNVKSAFILTKEVLKGMIERKSGKIIFISSIWGNSGASMESVYSASKSALIGLTKSLAKEEAESGITVNCVCPGVIDTKMNDMFTESEKADLIEKTPLHRFGKPNEVAELVYFLASESADFITGEVITLDGGFTL